MKISVEEVSKRFIRHTIFKHVSVDFDAGQSYALLGANGSGKSTLLRIIAGMQSPSKGTVQYHKEGRAIAPEAIYEHISFCAPGMELVEELTLREMLEFHFRFKPMLPQLRVKQIIELIGLQDSSNNFIANFSSGMKQRVKLAQAIFADTPVLLLDEPCTNLDQKGVQQYRSWLQEFSKNRLLIIASNEEREYDFCTHHFKMEAYK